MALQAAAVASRPHSPPPLFCCAHEQTQVSFASLHIPLLSSLPSSLPLSTFYSPHFLLHLSNAPKFSMRIANQANLHMSRLCIYNDNKTPFDKPPDKFFCPVCGAPKRRFRSYEPG